MCRPRTRPAAQSGLQMPSTRLGRWSPGGSRHCVGRRWRPRATSARVWGRTAARRTARHWTAHLAHGSDGRGGGTRLIWVSLRTARRPRGGGGGAGRCVWFVPVGLPAAICPAGAASFGTPLCRRVCAAGVCGECGVLAQPGGGALGSPCSVAWPLSARIFLSGCLRCQRHPGRSTHPSLRPFSCFRVAPCVPTLIRKLQLNAREPMRLSASARRTSSSAHPPDRRKD